MNEGISHFLLQLQCLLIGVVIAALHQADLSAEALGGLHLGDGGVVRQADDGLDTVFGSRQRHTLGVIAGRAGDYALRFFLLRQHGDFISGTAHLEGAGDLQIFRFQIQFTFRRNSVCPDHTGFPHDVFQNLLRVEYLVERQHNFFTPFPALKRKTPVSKRILL